MVRSPFVVVAALATLAILPAGAGAVEEAEKAAPPAASSEVDYYTRRARSVLEAEKALLPKPHALSASYPGKEIVVCEAGCADTRAPQVVFVRPEIPPVVETSESMMVPTSTSDGRSVPLDEVACVAGCYGAVASKVAAPAPALVPQPAEPAVSVEDWTPPIRLRESIDDKLSPVR
ncbi:hypothetical protein W911_17000 [Hyphomicrobium nitrativorans NL23]|uniref:Uncharacterized protein n=1 Tax=Hyphomicrobium nitrativorans NL23 TaxID=1029756 RepID=V5SIT3_9HYPH|nr:hypothetical protein W911_17000 [Hyphomicrobium nitrativorans NL23]